jgi:hypothetical protein
MRLDATIWTGTSGISVTVQSRSRIVGCLQLQDSLSWLTTQIAPVFRLEFNMNLSGNGSLPVKIQQLKIMDWTLNYNKIYPTDWTFHADNLNDLCVRSVCQ